MNKADDASQLDFTSLMKNTAVMAGGIAVLSQFLSSSQKRTDNVANDTETTK